MKGNLTPINRNNLFYSDADFQMECEIAENYIEEDLNQSVVLYEVDIEKTNLNAVYKDSRNIVYKPPREIPCMFEIKSSELKTYDNKSSNGVYSINGSLTLYVMPRTLVKYRCDIKRGDYIAVQIDTDRMVYFSVVDDGKVNTANSNYIGAYKTAWRVVECAPVTDKEFNGK